MLIRARNASSCVSFLLIAVTAAVPARAAVIYVDTDNAGPQNGTSWQTAFTSLQSALTAAQPGDQIWVAQGVYRPSANGDELISFALRDGVSIYGGFAGTETHLEQRNPSLRVTILSGELNNPQVREDNSVHVVLAQNVGRSARLDGFVVEAGDASGGPGGSTIDDRSGAGLIVVAASPTIANCTFRFNQALHFGMRDCRGGAVYCAEAAAPVFANCHFLSNAVIGEGGAVYCNASSPSFFECTFVDNHTGLSAMVPGISGDGGAVFCNSGSTPLFSFCSFQNNATGNGASSASPTRGGDGGAVCTIGANTVFTNCAFFQNRTGRGGDANTAAPGGRGGDGGAICIRSGSLTLAGCLLAQNQTGSGGGSYQGPPGRPGDFGGLLCEAPAQIVNSTVAGNDGSSNAGGTGGIRVLSGDVNNSILWGNLGAQRGGSSSLNYSCVQGYSPDFGGIGNTSADPLFAAPASDNYRLAAGSPCVDAASNLVLPEELTSDLDQRPRPVDDPATPDSGAGTPPIVDMGAYEFQDDCPDFDADGSVNLADLAILLSHFGTASGANFPDGDIDLDDDVDLADLALLLAQFGTPCG